MYENKVQIAVKHFAFKNLTFYLIINDIQYIGHEVTCAISTYVDWA